MAGRTPSEAFQAFIEPIEKAVKCLGPAKVTVSPKGRSTPNQDHGWSLNGFQGFTTKGWHFEAQMNYRIIQDDRPEVGPWRVSTTAYSYRLAVTGDDVFRFHWHPLGNSPVKYPHLHARLAPSDRLSSSLDAHLKTDRMSLERALSWAFEIGLPTARDDWASLLSETEAGHLAYRTWATASDHPDLSDGDE